MPAVQPTPPQPPVARFKTLLNHLFQAAFTARLAGWLPHALAVRLSLRMSFAQHHILRLAERIAAGKGPGLRPRQTPPASDTGEVQGTPGRPKRPSPQWAFPRQTGWLVPLVPEAILARGRMEDLLAEPEMQDFALAAPQVWRHLRPLCRALGVKRPGYLKPPPRPRKPHPPRGEPKLSHSPAAQRRAAWPGLNRPYRYHGPVANPWRTSPRSRGSPSPPDPPPPRSSPKPA
jgi:hypothetical protein